MRKLLLPLLIIICFSFPMVYAYEYSYNVMPHKGPYNQEILIWVRVTPIIDTTNLKVTVFMDKILIKTMHQLPSTQIGKTNEYKHSWDLFLTPPEGANNVGTHKIEIWIETLTGDIKILPYQYEITEGPLTTVTAWEQFIQENPKLIQQLTGPAGPIGDRGQIGVTGVQGKRGVPGEDGSNGNPGLIGVVGPQGLQGESGTSNYLMVLIICVITNGLTLAYLKYRDT